MKFRIADVNIELFLILAALPGAQPWKGLRPQQKRLHMACRDGDGFRTRRAILYSTKLGQIVAKRANGGCENYFTKMTISRPILGRFC